MKIPKNHKPKHDFPAIVLDLSINGLGIIRSLKRKGIMVYAYDVLSKYKKGRTLYAECGPCPHPIYEEDKLLDHLIKKGGNLKRKAVLFAGSDDYVFFISKFRDQLAEYFLFIMPDHSLIQSVLDKRQTYNLALKHNIPTPKTFFIENPDQLENIVEGLVFPCILKPAFSADYRKRMNKKAIIIESASQLRTLYPFYAQFGELMIQEFIPGDDHCVYEIATLFNKQMDLIGLFSSQKLQQYPPIFGSGVLVLSKKNEELVKMGVSFFKTLNFVGLAHAEYKMDPRDGTLKFIEINARTTVSNSLSYASGIDFSYLYYLMATGQNPPKELNQKEGGKWVHLVRNFLGFLENRKKGSMNFGKWIKSFTGVKAFASFRLDDPMPFIRGVISDLKYAWKNRR
ncbi:carboxylate--amine ligase [Bacillus sp. FJAT-18017]|uniref:carboxylate--amine ligase n=1 Tax=Bacillus sp. FJAT-18017 TaxID=1705566 RepID=UPI000AA17624|nr:carbamoyl-phosphate synthase [Bacillus sp. FJAT-18017]